MEKGNLKFDVIGFSFPFSVFKHLLLFSIFNFQFSIISSAQQLNQFLNQEYDSYNAPAIYNPQIELHTGFRPLIQSDINHFIPDTVGSKPLPKKSWLYRKVYQESLFIINDTAEHFYCTFDPLFNFQLSEDKSNADKKYYQNTRGVIVQGNIGSKFSFSTTFWENQASFPYYISQFVNESYVVPGNGRTKPFGTDGYDFSMSEAYLSFSPSSHFNFQFGNGKNFIGDGYRSLLLSDNSFSYPYVRITTSFWHIQYTNLYTVFTDLFPDPSIATSSTEGLFQRKAGSFQYLSWNIVPQVELGLFQGLIWTAANQYNQQSYNAYYFDPVIGVSALKYGLSNVPNVVLGSTIKYKINRSFMAYGQFVVDNKTGYQAGIKYFNKYGEFQLEYNQVQPYTYSSSDSLENYSHYDQALGDPLGANFKELIAIINFRVTKHFSVHLQGNYALEGLDSTGTDYGNNIFLPDTRATNTTNVTMLQGIRSTLTYMDAHISYLMNPKTNMNFTVGVSRRELTNDVFKEPATTLFYIGFRTSLENMYVDF